jgi:hypothetical protein
MSVVNPNNLGGKVSTRTTSWLDACMKAWGSEFHAPDHRIYQFSGGNNRDSTDKGLTGIYGVPGDVLLLLDGQQYPDMRDGLIAAVGATSPGVARDGLGSFEEIDIDPR